MIPRVEPTLAIIALTLSASSCAPPALPPLPSAHQAAYKPIDAAPETESWDAEWFDIQRSRTVAVRVYAPLGLPTPVPLIIFSHGLGGSREGYRYFGERLSACSYVVIHVEHDGSDTDAWNDYSGKPNEFVSQAIRSEANRIDRPADITFVIDHALKDTRLADRIDAARIAVAGHSLGALTACEMVGLRVDLDQASDVNFSDPRVRAAIAMSPFSAAPEIGLDRDAWRFIDRPVLYMTGTLDDEIGGRAPETRRDAFNYGVGANQYLLVIADATHLTFAGAIGSHGEIPVAQPAHLEYITMAATAFFDAYLRKNAAAATWLSSSSMIDVSGATCEWHAARIATAD